jgi:hypothetical protein
MAAPVEDGAVRLRVPSRPLLAVEHPCYVVNAERGMRMLGGLPAIARASASNSDCMECFLRPDDPLSHPLFGVLAPTPGFLLKVTRRPGSTTAGEAITAEVIGTVASSYRFEGLADYQYVSDGAVRAALDVSPRAANEPFDLVESLRPLEAHALRIPPALFSMYDTPLEYLPRSQRANVRVGTQGAPEASSAVTSAPHAKAASTRAAGAGGPIPPRRRRAQAGRAVPMHFGQRVEFGTDPTPLAPPEAIARTIDPHDELFVAMKAKFALRPIWSRQALRASLPSALYLTEERLRFRLPQLAYYFASGPWRMCWIAFGYDPRASPDARIYQVLDMRLPSEFDELVPRKSERSRIGDHARLRQAVASRGSQAAGSGGAGGGGGGVGGGGGGGGVGGGGVGGGAAECAGSGGGSSSSAADGRGGATGDVPATAPDGGGASEDEGDEGEAPSWARGQVPGDQNLPTQRHVYFQMCDFKGDELVQLVHEEIAPEFALPPQPAGGSGPARPHEKFGWYSQSTIENLRRLLKQSLQTLAKAQSDPTAASTHALGQPTSRTLLQHSAPPPSSAAAAAAYTPSAVVGIAPGTARASSVAVKGTTAAVPPPAAMESRMHAHLGRGALRLPVEAAGGSLAATAGGLPAVGAVEGISAASDGLVEGISAASDDLVEGVAAAAPLAFGIFGDDVHDMEDDMEEEEDLAAGHVGAERVLVGMGAMLGADEAGLGQRGAKRGREEEEGEDEEDVEGEEGEEGEEGGEEEVAMAGVGAGVRNDGEEDGEEDEDEVGEDDGEAEEAEVEEDEGEEEDEEEEEEGLIFRTG